MNGVPDIKLVLFASPTGRDCTYTVYVTAPQQIVATVERMELADPRVLVCLLFGLKMNACVGPYNPARGLCELGRHRVDLVKSVSSSR
jgi:hypothetical protein